MTPEGAWQRRLERKAALLSARLGVRAAAHDTAAARITARGETPTTTLGSGKPPPP